MNKILLTQKGIEYKLDKNIEYEYNNDSINKLKIKVLGNTKLELVIKDFEEIKLNIEFEVLDNVKFDVYEVKKNIKAKILNNYKLNLNSIINITKVYDINTINEKNIVNLNGNKSKVNFILKTVSKNLEKYDILINHNALYTESDVITNGLNTTGNLYFTVSTLVPNGIKNCVANQQNRIINLTDKECNIKPNLLIEEVDVTANHSALIGGFKDEEIFYMQRLGLSKEVASKLLIEGFLKSKISNKLATNFKKYWR